ncbi:MAG: A/G-specific adenine glycosylase [Chthonomonas sp.]|nr:A/G-specific adenine glycosylase [Chthonomonas sp.]
MATVIPYWERWLEKLPTVHHLAKADVQDVLGLWAGLGYYQRARNLHRGAQWIVEHGFPKSYSEWLKVPGVGMYTAGAIASICLGEAVPAVDGNVHRVYARLMGSNAELPKLANLARGWANGVVFKEAPGEWNQALMELGARVCRPREASCSTCPIESQCKGKENPLQYPVPKVKKESVELIRYAALCRRMGSYAIRQTASSEWAGGMWEFPTREEPWSGEVIGEIRHVITHHRIKLRVQDVRDQEFEDWKTAEEIARLPLSAAQRRVYRQFVVMPTGSV